LAALTAAIVAGLAGKANSIATIFTLDIYKKYLNKDASEGKMVWVGKLTIIASIVVAVLFTWNDTLGIGGAGGFTFIQKYTGVISPPVSALFVLGMFWNRTTGPALIAGLIRGFVFAVVFTAFAVQVCCRVTWLVTASFNKFRVYQL